MADFYEVAAGGDGVSELEVGVEGAVVGGENFAGEIEQLAKGVGRSRSLSGQIAEAFHINAEHVGIASCFDFSSGGR